MRSVGTVRNIRRTLCDSESLSFVDGRCRPSFGQVVVTPWKTTEVDGSGIGHANGRSAKKEKAVHSVKNKTETRKYC